MIVGVDVAEVPCVSPGLVEGAAVTGTVVAGVKVVAQGVTVGVRVVGAGVVFFDAVDVYESSLEMICCDCFWL